MQYPLWLLTAVSYTSYIIDKDSAYPVNSSCR
jgi:hypothetical protein